MNRKMLIVTAAALLARGIAQADDKAEITAKLNQTYAQLRTAFENKDMDKWSSFFDARAFQATDAKGKTLTFSQERDEWQKQFPSLRNLQEDLSIQDVQVEHGKIVVAAKRQFHCEANVPKYGWTPIVMDQDLEQVWRAEAGSLKLVASHILHERQDVDQKWLAERKAMMQQSTRDILDWSKEMRQSRMPCARSYNGCPQ